MNGIAGKVFAVTGAGGGIGEAVCQRLVDEGAIVYALDLQGAAVGHFVATDVTDQGSLEAALDAILAREGSVDGVVAAAGVVEDDVAAEAMDIALFDKVLGVNLRGVFLTCQVFGRRLLERGAGRIVNISSMSGNHVVNRPQRQCAYNASKAGVSALTRSLAAEWGPRGVRLNAVAPGYVNTPLLSLKQHQFGEWLSRTPLGRMAEPSEVAATICFLLSDDADFYCGSEVVLDGGYTLI